MGISIEPSMEKPMEQSIVSVVSLKNGHNIRVGDELPNGGRIVGIDFHDSGYRITVRHLRNGEEILSKSWVPMSVITATY